MTEIIRVAGIDPGLRTTGYGIVNYNLEKNEIWVSNCGLVKTPQRFKGTEAILYMIDHMREVSQRECFDECARVVIEFPASFYNPKFSGGALTPVAAISGACMVLFQKEEGRVYPVYPTVWNGGKKKIKTAAIIMDAIGHPQEWEFDDNPTREADFEHIIDGVGMAYWLMQRDYFEREANVI